MDRLVWINRRGFKGTRVYARAPRSAYNDFEQDLFRLFSLEA